MPSLRQLRRGTSEERLGFSEYIKWVNSAGSTFPTYGGSSASSTEDADASFSAFAQVYKTNGIVFACMEVRRRIFSQVAFRFVGMNDGKLGRMFGGPGLDILSRPWPNGTTGELASRMIQDADLAGNFFAVRRGDRLYRRDPSKVSIVLNGNPLEDEFADVVGYVYRPGGNVGPSYTYEPHEMCHWTPLTDPEAAYKGMSPLRSIVREVRADNAATDHKAKFFANGATPNMVVKFPESVMTEAQFERFKEKLNQEHAGSTKAYKTLYLAPGADVQVVGRDFQQMDFANTQGRDETRIAAAFGVPAAIVGLKESLSGSSLNAGNYSAARRNLADGTMRPLFMSAAAALEALVPAPQGKGPAKLWYDDSDVAFFREDRADAATIQQAQATTLKTHIDAGFEPDSAVAAVEADDRSLLVHSGLYSVQLMSTAQQEDKPFQKVGLPALVQAGVVSAAWAAEQVGAPTEGLPTKPVQPPPPEAPSE